MPFTEDTKNIYGGENNRAWNQHLYLQEKAREARELREKQVAYAEEFARGLKEKTMSDDWTIFDEYEAQRNIQIEAFKNDLTREESELEKRPNVNENVWIKNPKLNWYVEELYHTFKNYYFQKVTKQVHFSVSRSGLSETYDPLLVCASDDLDSFSQPFKGDEAAAKKFIESAIKDFDKKEHVDLYQIRNYFIFQQNEFLNKSSLEKINEHFEKNATVEPDGTNKNKQIFPDNMTISDDGKRVFVDILNQINGSFGWLPIEKVKEHFEKQKEHEQGQIPPLERRNINSKEKIMSDEFEEQGEQELSPEQKAFREAVQHAGIQRKVIADAVKAGTLCCLPGTDGYADTKPAFNILNPNGIFYHGSNLLYLKEFQQKNGFPTGEYITYQQIENAKKDNPNLFIREGQKGISIHVNEKIGVNEWEDKHIRLFNVAQVSNPEKLKNWAEQQLEEAEKKDLEWKKTHYGSNYEAPAPKQKEPGPEIVCSSTEPAKYLGQYFAAVSMGGKFKVSPEQAAEFSEKMINTLYKKLEPTIGDKGEIKEPPKNKQTGEPITDVFSLEKISREANKFCKEFMRDLKIEAQKQNQPEQQQEQEQTQSRGGRGM